MGAFHGPWIFFIKSFFLLLGEKLSLDQPGPPLPPSSSDSVLVVNDPTLCTLPSRRASPDPSYLIQKGGPHLKLRKIFSKLTTFWGRKLFVRGKRLVKKSGKRFQFSTPPLHPEPYPPKGIPNVPVRPKSAGLLSGLNGKHKVWANFRGPCSV